MTNKETRTVTVDPEVDDYLAQKEVNASGLVNDLVSEYMHGSKADVAALDLQIQHKENRIDELDTQLQRVENEKEELQQLRNEIKEEQLTRWEEAAMALEGTPKEVGNPAVENWASKLGVPEETLLEKINGIDIE